MITVLRRSLADSSVEAKAQWGIAADKLMAFETFVHIDGMHLISDIISADRGFLEGTSYGDNARIVGGAVDVTIDGENIKNIFTVIKD